MVEEAEGGAEVVDEALCEECGVVTEAAGVVEAEVVVQVVVHLEAVMLAVEGNVVVEVVQEAAQELCSNPIGIRAFSSPKERSTCL